MIITPSKHTEIKYSVLFISSKVLKYLRQDNIIKLNDLIELLVVDFGDKVKNNINIALTFLYAWNKIEYIKDLDAISIKENNENS